MTFETGKAFAQIIEDTHQRSFQEGRRFTAEVIKQLIDDKKPFDHNLEGVAAQLALLDRIESYVAKVIKNER